MPANSVEHLRRLELVMQHTTNMVVVTNREREIEWVNPAYTRITGWTLDEVRGRNPRSFLHGPRTSLTASSRLGALLRRGEPVQGFEMLNYTKSGEAYWVSMNIQPIVDAQGQVAEYVAIETDITQRKRSEMEAAQAFRRLAHAQRIARLGTIEHRLAAGRLHCSQEVCRILGLTAGHDEICYEDLLDRIHADDRDAVRARYEEAINGASPYEQEFRVVDQDDDVRWVLVRGVVEGWDDGRDALFRLAVQDITEAKRNEQLRRDKELLEHAVQTQMEVLSRVSHELRTPLHAVLGFTEMVERVESARLSEPSHAHLRHIRDSARHLLLIVNDILDLTQLHSGKVAFDSEPVDLLDLAEQVLAMVDPLAREHGVATTIHVCHPHPWAVADRRRLLQVLINLAANGVKYNRRGGSVEIRLGAGPASRVSIAVRDSGIGIAPEDLTRIFDPFYRVARDDARARANSSGLGLAIAHTLVQGMGGSLEVDSRLGEGSTFVVGLPAAPHGRVQSDIALDLPGPSAEGGPQGRVLYIEDNEVNCLLIESYLAARPGIELVCRTTGSDGLAAARQLRPTLILVDMHLPDMSGDEVVRAVLADPLLYRTPCIAFSAGNDGAAIESAIRAGFREYLCKPIAAADFLAALDRLMEDEPLSTRF